MTEYHVLRTADGRYASKTWDARHHPAMCLTPDLNQHEITRVVCLYTSYSDAVCEACKYHDVLGEVLFPAPVDFFGAGPQTVLMEKQDDRP